MHKPYFLPSTPFKVKIKDKEQQTEMLRYLCLKNVLVPLTLSLREYLIVYEINNNLVVKAYDTDNARTLTFWEVVNATDLTKTFFSKDTQLPLEQVFILFLKQHRMYSAWKRDRVNSFSLLQPPIPVCELLLYTKMSCTAKWRPIDNKWRKLCEFFNISENLIYLHNIK